MKNKKYIYDVDQSDLWDYRVKNELCLSCGKVLSEKDKEFDKDPRKDCQTCLIAKRKRIARIVKFIDVVKKDPFKHYDKNGVCDNE